MATTEYADFNGKWELDAALSDPPDEMLSMQGVGWLRRKMASAAQSLVATTVDMTPERMKVEINTPVMNRSEEFLLDGTPVTKDEDFLGIGSVTITSTWEDDKKVRHGASAPRSRSSGVAVG